MSDPIILLYGGKYILKGNEFLVRGSELTYNYKENIVIIDTPENVTSILLYDSRSVDGNLNVVGCSSLKVLTCSGNLINTINASKCLELTHIFCAYNKIESIDISGCSKLYWLFGYENSINYLSIKGCTSIYDLSISENKFTYIDAIDCINIKRLDLRYNLLTNESIDKVIEDLSKTKLEDGICCLGKDPKIPTSSLSLSTKTSKEDMENNLGWNISIL